MPRNSSDIAVLMIRRPDELPTYLDREGSETGIYGTLLYLKAIFQMLILVLEG